MEEPKPEDFGLTSDLIKKFEDIEKENGKPPYAGGVQVIAMFFFLLVGGLSGDEIIRIFSLLLWAIFAAVFYFYCKIIAKNRMNRFPDSYGRFKSKKYDFIHQRNRLNEEKIRVEKETQKLQREESRKTFEYWTTIDPYKFESEIALLFQKNGFSASATKGSGDGGVDIELQIRSKKGVVQCKRQKTKVSPGVARDLYGTMIAGGYDFGFVVCPAGFSNQTFEFVKGKKIRLIGLKRIVEMANQDSPLIFLNFD